jgi:hypothetical protein
MTFRKLRIAWSVVWGVVAVLLVVLWARSYQKWDTIWSPSIITHDAGMSSNEGGAYFFLYSTPPAPPSPLWQSRTITADISLNWRSWQRRMTFAGFGITRLGTMTILLLPHWFCKLLIGSFATAPWLSRAQRRFSLRTLLIATTLVAVVLGLAVYASGH